MTPLGMQSSRRSGGASSPAGTEAIWREHRALERLSGLSRPRPAALAGRDSRLRAGNWPFCALRGNRSDRDVCARARDRPVRASRQPSAAVPFLLHHRYVLRDARSMARTISRPVWPTPPDRSIPSRGSWVTITEIKANFIVRAWRKATARSAGSMPTPRFCACHTLSSTIRSTSRWSAATVSTTYPALSISGRQRRPACWHGNGLPFAMLIPSSGTRCC